MQQKISELAKSNHIKRVWIGDPCYVFPKQLWDKFCEKIFNGGEREVGYKLEFSFEDFVEAGVNIKTISKIRKMDSKDLVVLQCGTAYGDGVYPSDTGFGYGVDAGCLAIIPDYLVSEEAIANGNDTRLGKYFKLENPGGISLITDGKGEFRFGDDFSTIEMIFTGDPE